MHKYLFILVLGVLLSCQDGPQASQDAQLVVDRAIDASGGNRYKESEVRFVFRDREYVSGRENGQTVLKRIAIMDSIQVEDVRIGSRFQRRVGGELQVLPDTTSQKYSESVNSVHYFARLPYGLNDPAVNKEYLGTVKIGDSTYHKIEVTFDQEGGGTDYEDVFVYWFNTESYVPGFLAYEYHTNGGGKRFRVAYNPRVVGGIRFLDYRNYEYEGPLPVSALDSLYQEGSLKLLSLIELEAIRVVPGSYN